MKRRWVISLLVLTIASVAVLLFKYWPRTTSDNECSALYRRYLDRDGIQASYIQGKAVCDTLRVDVTLLQATSPSGWQQLCNDFNIPTPDSSALALLQDGNPDITLSILPPHFSDPSQEGTHTPNPSQEETHTPDPSQERTHTPDPSQEGRRTSDMMLLAASSHTLRCVSVFHITTPQQFDALVGHHIDQLNP